MVEPAAIPVRVEIMESQQCRIVGKSQSILMMIHPIVSTRTRTTSPTALRRAQGPMPSNASMPTWIGMSLDKLEEKVTKAQEELEQLQKRVQKRKAKEKLNHASKD
jgi:hypothetical protein